MFHLILLAILTVSSYHAIISTSSPPENTIDPNTVPYNPIIRLSQNFLYSFTFPSSTSPNTSNSAFFSLASNNQSCGALFCYYGWVHNYTLNDKTYDGYTLANFDNPMVFMIKGFTNKTFSLTIDRQLSIQKINILDLCSKVSNPLAVQISSLNPNNKSPKTQYLAVYDFVSLSEANKIQQLKKAINLQELPDGNLANTTFVGINKTSSQRYSSFIDILAVDSSSNIILSRKVTLQDKIRVKQVKEMTLKVKSSTRFSNIEPIMELLSDLSQKPANSNNLSIVPQNIQLSQVKLTFS